MYEPDDVLAQVRASATANGLVLFLGAGVNGLRYPQWGELVTRLLEVAMRQHVDGREYAEWLNRKNVAFDLYARATLAKALLGKNYIEVLRQQVYFGDERKESHVKQVARLCRWDAVKAVVTYNYDTHLEDAYQENFDPKRDRPIVSVGLSRRGQEPSGRSKRLCVYHVHGRLASPEHLHYAKDDPVVLAYDEYTDVMRDACNWASATQMHFLRTHTCLFLGLSLSDWNVLRLVGATHAPRDPLTHWLLTSKQEFAVPGTRRKPPGTSKSRIEKAHRTMTDFHRRAKATLLESIGIQYALVGDTYKDLYDSVAKLKS